MRNLDLIPDSAPAARVRVLFESPIGSPDRYVGTMLGVAIGDALGRPGEGRHPNWIAETYGELDEYHPWRGWNGGPTGTVTDDTQMTMCIASSIVAHEDVDPDDIAGRFVQWLPVGRGKGRTCTAAVERLISGAHWGTSGVDSAGNGAAMRVAPVGLFRAHDVGKLRRDAAISAVITHAHPTAVLSAVAQAAAIGYLSRVDPNEVDPEDLLAVVDLVVGDLPDPGVRERRPGAGGRRVRLLDRLWKVADLLHLEDEEAMRRLHNGAFVLESLPASWWFFLRYLRQPERALVRAASAGRDADTVASMTGALVGALHGGGAFPRKWTSDLEFHDELVRLGSELHRISGSRTRPDSPSRMSSSAADDSGPRPSECSLGPRRETDVMDALTAPAFLRLRTATDRYLRVLRWLAQRHGDDFSDAVLGIRGHHRQYFARSRAEIVNSGRSTRPRRLVGTDWWVLTNTETARKQRHLEEILAALEYSPHVVEAATSAVACGDWRTVASGRVADPDSAVA